MLEAFHMLKVTRSTIAEKGTVMYDEGEVKLQVHMWTAHFTDQPGSKVCK